MDNKSSWKFSWVQIFAVILVIVISVSLYGLASKNKSHAINNVVNNTANNTVNNTANVEIKGDDAIGLAKALTTKGAKMYGASYCSACQYQKGLFGDAFKYVTYVECADANGGQTKACFDKKIEAYPTWIIPGQAEPLVGARDLQELADVIGFQLSK